MTDDYFAGLFDGEGTLRISRNGRQYQLLISLGMTAEEPIKALRERFGGWIEHRSNTGTQWKPVYIWRGSSGTAIRFLDAVQPLLCVKKRQAEIARQFQDEMTHATPALDPRKAALYEQMKEANKRGA